MSIEQSLIALCGIFLLACCSPGPVFLLIASTSARHGRPEGLRVALGVAGATLMWSSLTIMGLGAFLASAVWAQTAIRLAAGLYLLWLGLCMIRSGLRRGPVIALPRPSRRSAFLQGFLTSATNPKALAFFGSAFALTAPQDPTLRYHLAAIAALTTLSALWHSLLAILFAAPALQRGYRGLKRQIDLCLATLLIALGGSMISHGVKHR